MSYYRTQVQHPAHKRPSLLALGFVILLHVSLITAISNGLGDRVTKVILSPPKLTVIDPPPAKPPTKEFWEDVEVTKPGPVNVDQHLPPLIVDTGGGITEETHRKSDQVITTAIEKVVTLPRLDPHHPVTQPSYPISSRRAGEEGTVELMLYVLANGHVGDAKIERSSGFSKLDEAAMQEALRSWRLLPQTVDGVNVAAWHKIAITFHLKN